MGVEYNTEVVSFMIDPIEIVGYCPPMRKMIFMDAVTLVGNHVVTVPIDEYQFWMNHRDTDYYAKVS